jgi:EAL and modified HD-GYP domain-containing signal transduction protein
MNSALDCNRDVFVGRQPILGPNLKTIGYEVLYRNCEVGQAIFTDESVATATVLLNTYLDIGLEHVVGSHLAFLNIPKQFILERYCEALPKKRVVLEILENVEPTPEVLEALHSLSNQGYIIALDDFVYNDHVKAFLEIADIVKIEVAGKSKEQIQQELAPLQNSRNLRVYVLSGLFLFQTRHHPWPWNSIQPCGTIGIIEQNTRSEYPI